MPRADWTRFWSDQYNPAHPQGPVFTARGPAFSGGGSRSLSLDVRAAYISPPGFIGFTYSGPSASSFLLDGSISGAVRSKLASYSFIPYYGGVGFFARARKVADNTRPVGVIAIADYATYWIGTTRASQTVGTSSVLLSIYRCIAGVQTPLTTTVSIPTIETSFAQFEARFKTNGSSVDISTRHNAGSSISLPGSAGWTSWGLAVTDTSPGVLLTAGYWGFGTYQSVGGDPPGGTTMLDAVNWDYITINTMA